MRRWFAGFGFLASVVSFSAVSAAAAEEWPTHPVRIVNTFAAGGAADVLCRIVAAHLTEAFHQQFYVETRPGAAGAIGVQSVVSTPPDGYNFVLTNVSILSVAPTSKPKLSYNPKRDLTHIAYIAGSPIVLSVNPKSGWKSIADFVAAAKKSGKPMTYSSSGIGSMGQLIGESFAHLAGIEVEHVPYKGASQGLMDLVAGHIAFSSQTVSSTAGQLRGGGLVGLAITANERLPDYPDIPTFKEVGYPGLVSTIWFSLSAPAGLPADIVAKVNHEIVKGMATPETQARLRQDGMITEPMTPEELSRYVDAETARWKPVIERAGLVAK